ncbi:hypothetical protein GBAR_LOCUS25826 [Geodia barretti]|uniref:Uncharacterized protein n=1 Tax=Geodia barretti TaxID=519541 RepID=A0AA35TFD9_GEOBA|nr:hypothetical protein GBAR_LOCUS25826 [Geodia barretti]
MEKCTARWAQCFTNYWTSNSIRWRTVVCQNPFSPGHCLLDSSIDICSEDQLDACTCEPTQPPTTTEPVPTMPPVGERCIYTDADLEIDEENRYTITTCFDESEGTLCLAEVPLPECSSSDFCRSYWWETFFIEWNIVVCRRPSGYCFLKSTIPNCLEAQGAT